VLDKLEDSYGVNIFGENLKRLSEVIADLCSKDSVETFKITGYKSKPYMLEGKEMRVFRTPIPCEWVNGDEGRALILAQKLVGYKIYDNEQDAIDAWNEKNKISVDNVVAEQVDPGF